MAHNFYHNFISVKNDRPDLFDTLYFERDIKACKEKNWGWNNIRTSLPFESM